MNDRTAKPLSKCLRPHRGSLLLILAVQAVAVLAQVGAITLLKPILDIGAFDKDVGTVLELGAVLLGLTMVTLISLVAVSYVASRVATSVASELRVGIITAALKSERMDSMGDSTTKAMTSLTTDVNTFQNFLYETLRTYVPMPLLLLVLLYLTFDINGAVGVMITAVLAVIVVTTLAFGSRVYRMYPRQVEATDRVNNRLREKITGYRAIRTYGAWDYESAKFEEASNSLGSLNRRVGINSYFIPNLTTALIWISIITIYMVASLDAYGDTVDPTKLLLFMQYTTYIVATLALLPYLSTEAPRAMNCFHRIQDMLASAAGTSDSAEPEASPDADPLVFEDVYVTDDRGRHTVNGVSLTVRKGEVLTLVGPNGCGASDLIGAALGFRVPDKGRSYAFGVEIVPDRATFARRRTVYVGSKTGLLRGTLRFNLDPRGERTDGEILEMCGRCGLGPLLRSMPGGLDTQMDVNDAGVSGGQRQLVSIVRGLLRDAEVYVFDNCFFSLDRGTRARTMDTLLEVCAGKTVVFCMHDVSTCPVSDRVVVMEGGRVTVSGSTDEVAGSSPFYRKAVGFSQGGDARWA